MPVPGVEGARRTVVSDGTGIGCVEEAVAGGRVGLT